jgi:GntR family transcriptional regulator / MocR family aminotransferase
MAKASTSPPASASGPSARAAFVTPSHHYALGVTMSASRRLQLLEWSRQASAWIVEDDYDSEYRFESMPIPSLQGLDPCPRHLYRNLQQSPVPLPAPRLHGHPPRPRRPLSPPCVSPWTSSPPISFRKRSPTSCLEGHFARHIRRMRSLYKARRAALVESLHAEFGDFLRSTAPKPACTSPSPQAVRRLRHALSL